MYTAWTQHLKDPNEKIRWQNTVVAAKPVLEHIRTLLTSLEVGVGQDEVNKEYYSSPSWAYRQAHNNGYRHCLKTVLSLIDLDKQVIKDIDHERRSTERDPIISGPPEGLPN